MPSEDALLRAIEVDDSYEVVRTISRGAQGRVEVVRLREGVAAPAPSAWAPDDSRVWIRKRMPCELADQEVWEAAARIRCASLPRIERTYRLPDQFVVIMEHVEGRTVEELVGLLGSLSLAEARRVMGGVCGALSALHGADPAIIHRDVTPANVIVSASRVVLADLGIARFQRHRHRGGRLGGSASVDGSLASGFSTGAAPDHDTRVLGTRGYAAPEQFGFAQTDVRSDVYAAGALLGFMLTGVAPDDESFAERLAQTGAVPVGVAEVVHRAMSFEPSRRYAGARELLDALDRALREMATTGGPAYYGTVPAGSHARGAASAWDDAGQMAGAGVAGAGVASAGVAGSAGFAGSADFAGAAGRTPAGAGFAVGATDYMRPEVGPEARSRASSGAYVPGRIAEHGLDVPMRRRAPFPVRLALMALVGAFDAFLMLYVVRTVIPSIAAAYATETTVKFTAFWTAEMLVIGFLALISFGVFRTCWGRRDTRPSGSAVQVWLWVMAGFVILFVVLLVIVAVFNYAAGR